MSERLGLFAPAKHPVLSLSVQAQTAAPKHHQSEFEVLIRHLLPARVGQPSPSFLSWNGTELICIGGHGLLHVPEMQTSWFSEQRWLYLYPSSDVLFSEPTIASTGYF